MTLLESVVTEYNAQRQETAPALKQLNALTTAMLLMFFSMLI